MKKIKKGLVPVKLKEYLKNNPTGTWENDFKNSCEDGYKEVIKQLKKDQGGICCYCEIDFGNDEVRDDFRVEHFHPKRDSNEVKNWDLDWDNLLGCCHGGSDKYVLSETRFIQNKKHRHSDVLKSDFFWDEEILNPLSIQAFPPIFEVYSDGEMKVIEENCDSTTKLKATNSLDTKKLNLNSPKLKEWRKEVIDKLRDDVKSFYEISSNMEIAVKSVIYAQLAKDANENHPRFFTTIRSFFKNDAENYLKEVGYDG